MKRRAAYWLVALVAMLGAGYVLLILWPMVTTGGHP